MSLSVTKASKEWGVSRNTIYVKIRAGELSQNSNKTIDPTEMLRVFGEPKYKSTTKNKLQIEHEITTNYELLQQQLQHEKQLRLIAEKQLEKEEKRAERIEQEKNELLKSVTELSQSIKLLEMKNLEKDERKSFLKKFF